jgi:hypothetical protein
MRSSGTGNSRSAKEWDGEGCPCASWHLDSVGSSDADPDPFDPDPTFHFDTDPDPAFQFDTDSDPTV